MDDKKKLLLHVCCGPCSTSSIERLLNDNWMLSLFYSNSNIYPQTEWEKRLDGVIKTANYFGIDWFCDDYLHTDWLMKIKGFEYEPEKGKRCNICFAYSFKRSSEKATKENYAGFTSSLTVSPHKNSENIFLIGNRYENFIEYNFKKKNGYKRSLELSNKIGLYRQNYCGCEFSIR